MTDALYSPLADKPLRWGIVAWFGLVHSLGMFGLVYMTAWHFDWRTLALLVGLFYACHISITVGMHRLYAHSAFKASRMLEILLLIFSAGTFQSSALWWAAYHVLHHVHADTELDPYSVRRSFIWAHMGWAVHAPDTLPPNAKSLAARYPLLMWQHRYYLALAFVAGLILPTALGALWNDWLGGLLVGGFLRLTLQYHLTWVINSVSHTYGHNRYAEDAGTAKTNGGLLALLTVGESFHERHHLAPSDYRLGTRWYDLDVGKWVIRLLAFLRLAEGLKTVPEASVASRAKSAALAA